MTRSDPLFASLAGVDNPRSVGMASWRLRSNSVTASRSGPVSNAFTTAAKFSPREERTGSGVAAEGFRISDGENRNGSDTSRVCCICFRSAYESSFSSSMSCNNNDNSSRG